MNEQQEIDRGRRAQELLENPLIAEFFDQAEREIWQQFKTSPLRDAEGREKLRLMQEWLTKFRMLLETHVTTGKLAMQANEERNTLMDRVRSAITPSWFDAD